MKCINCGVAVSEGEDLQLGSYVASDCQPVQADLRLAQCRSCGHVQKSVDAVWQSTCEAIYSNYRIYHQAEGKEQKARGVSGGPLAARSDLITRFLEEDCHLANTGSVLDIGCGNGAFLRAFNAARPGWQIYGAELNPSFEADILRICAGARFLSPSSLASTREQFDLITLIHCLEHISDPSAYLSNMRRMLSDTSLLLIEVPDAENNPFDLCIADHASHFSVGVLENVVERAGFEVVHSGNLVLSKELTLIARTRKDSEQVFGDREIAPWLATHVAALERLSARTAEIAQNGPVGVFGSSIAASWLASEHGDWVAFFVDEDPDRIGRQHMGRPIHSPADVPDNAIVIAALAPRLAATIAARMSSFPWRLVNLW